MISYQLSERVRRTPAEVFSFVAIDQVQNHPRWEEEVVEIRRPSPLGVGTRGTMVRREGRRVREVPFEVTELVPDRRIRFASGEGGFHLDLTFDMLPASGGETDFQVRAELRLTGFLRVMTPLFAVAFPRRGARITRRMKELLDQPRAAA